MKSKNKGFSILELMLVLVAAVFFSTLAFAGYRVIQEDLQVKQHASLLNYLISVADSSTMVRNDYQVPTSSGASPITSSNIIDMTGSENEFPSGSSASGGSIMGPLGPVSVGTSSSVGSANDLLNITTTNVPSSMCSALVIKMAPGVYDMSINNNLVALSPEPDASSSGRSEANPAQVIQLCSQGNATILVRKLKEINYSAMRHSGFGSFTGNEASVITPLYNRTEAAMAAREAAQRAL